MSDRKMHFFVVLMVTWHYGRVLASPFAQAQDDDYINEAIYEDIDYPGDFCFLPQELGLAGKTDSIFKILFDI